MIFLINVTIYIQIIKSKILVKGMKTKQEKTIAYLFSIILITLMTLNIIIWHQNQKSIEQFKKVQQQHQVK